MARYVLVDPVINSSNDKQRDYSMCQICSDAIDLVNSLASPDDEVTILDVERSVAADRARELDILSVPCVVIDSEVAGCYQKGFPYKWDTLKNAGLGQPLPKT